MFVRLRHAMIALLLLVGTIFVPVLSAQSNVEEMVITNIDASEFPQVAVHFRALDSNGFPVTALQANMFSIKEGSSQIAPENLASVEKGLCVHFMVDAGVWLYGASWQNAKEAITDFAQTTPWMKEDLDQVALTVIESGGARQLVGYTADSEALVTAVNNYTPPRGSEFSRPAAALQATLEELEMNPPEGCNDNRPKFIMYMTSGMESGTGQIGTVTTQAKTARIPIYTVLLSTRTEQQQNLQQLADESGGKYIQYTNRNNMSAFFTQLTEYRNHYELTYRSKVNSSGTQSIELVATVGAGTRSTAGQYDITVDPPRALISSPSTNASIVRTADAYTTDTTILTPTSYPVVASVIFPDDHIRRLRQARLFVNGVVAQTVTNPNPNNDIELLWNLQNIQEAGTFSLEVEIEDELGLRSKSPAITANVDIRIPAPDPGAGVSMNDIEATVTVIVGGSIPATATPIPCFSPDVVCNRVERPLRSNPTSFASLGLALLSMIFAGVVWVKRDSAPVRAVTDTVRRGVDTITKRYLGPAEARAYLVVLEGDVNVGKTLEIYGDTPIGRSRQTAELVFQQYDDNSPISRLHCTITDEEDHFTIKDEDSANGTFLNGNRLSPLAPEPLHDGDEIELGRVERGGVRLLFQPAGTGADDSQVGRMTKKTHSVGSSGQKENDSDNQGIKERF